MKTVYVVTASNELEVCGSVKSASYVVRKIVRQRVRNGQRGGVFWKTLREALRSKDTTSILGIWNAVYKMDPITLVVRNIQNTVPKERLWLELVTSKWSRGIRASSLWSSRTSPRGSGTGMS